MKNLFLTLGILIATIGFCASQPYEVKPGEHVLFYGDSITQQRLYTSFVETYTVTRFPTLNATFTNSGWGGDRVTGGHGGDITKRLNRDLYPFKPDVITIMLGMNDGRYKAFEKEIYDTYAKGLAHIVKDIRGKLPDARITLIEPSPYDDYTREPKFTGGYNEVLIDYGKYVRKLAKQNNLLCADLNGPVVNALKNAYKINPKTAQDIIKDRVHPQPGGHLLMAAELLKAWNAPTIVTYVEIDASKPSAKAANTQLSDLKLYKDGILKWTQLDAALPFPINFGDATISLAVRASDFVQTLNQQPLKVTNLSADYYELLIDDVSVGIYKKEDLSRGINLAVESTPMVAQAHKVHELTVRHNNVRHDNWRQIEVPSEGIKNLDEVVRDLRTGQLALVKLQHEIAQPIPRHYTLSPTSAEAGRGYSIVEPGKPQIPRGYNPVNLALKKPYETTDVNKSSSSWSTTTSLTDGSWEPVGGKSFATNHGQSFPKHVTIDLQATQTLGCIIAGVPPFGSTRTVIVSLSTDGKKFTSVGKYVFSQRKEEKRVFIFAPQDARYIRLTYPDKYEDRVGYDPNYMFTTEVEAYAPEDAKITVTPSPQTPQPARDSAPQPATSLPSGLNPVNLALHKPYVSSDKNTNARWGVPTSLTDGSWEAAEGKTFATGTGRFPKHVTIDLEKDQMLSCIVAGVPPFGSTKTIEVSISTDGKKFSKIGSHVFSLKKEEKHFFTFKPQKARYIRLTYVNNYSEKVRFHENFAFTSEVEAYGPAK